MHLKLNKVTYFLIHFKITLHSCQRYTTVLIRLSSVFQLLETDIGHFGYE